MRGCGHEEWSYDRIGTGLSSVDFQNPDTRSAQLGALHRFREGIDLSDAQDLNLILTHILLETARQQDEAQRLAG